MGSTARPVNSELVPRWIHFFGIVSGPWPDFGIEASLLSGWTCARALNLSDYFKYLSNHSSQTRSLSESCTGSPGSCPAVGMAMNFTVTPLSLSAWYIAYELVIGTRGSPVSWRINVGVVMAPA